MLLRHPKRTWPKEVSARDAKKPRHSMLASSGSLGPTIHVNVTLAPSKRKDGDCEQQEDDRFYEYGKIGLWDNSKWDENTQATFYPVLDLDNNIHDPPLQNHILSVMDMFRGSDKDEDAVWSWVQDRFTQLRSGILKENAWARMLRRKGI